MKELLESRSHRRVHKDVAKAAHKQEELLDKGKLSLASGMGKLSIIVSGAPDFKSSVKPQDQRKYFLEEAERLRDERLPEHQRVTIRQRAIPSDIKFELIDDEVTDMIFIGHGSIGVIWTDGGAGKFDWRNVAKTTKHLKQGKIEQRMCGNFPLDYNVPLGTFAVKSLGNVSAAPNVIVPDIHPNDNLFVPIYNDTDKVINQIDRLNNQYRGVAPTVARPESSVTP